MLKLQVGVVILVCRDIVNPCMDHAAQDPAPPTHTHAIIRQDSVSHTYLKVLEQSAASS